MSERQAPAGQRRTGGSSSTERTTARSRVKAKPTPSLASLADRHELYELAVQHPPSEVEFVAGTFESLRGRAPLSLREDFAGTSVFSLEWVRSHPRRSAIAVDLDRATLDWGLHNRIEPAGLTSRITQRCANVLDASPPLVDVAVAFNFSYWCFETRPALLAYFRAARAGLVAGGMFVLDAYGGTGVPQPDVTERECQDEDGLINGGRPYTYVWEHLDYNPVDAHMNCAIHFEFEDGSRMQDAFTYSWRVWTLAELRELLIEAGFAKVRVWVDQEDDDGEGTGHHHEVASFDNTGVWWVFVTAENS